MAERRQVIVIRGAISETDAVGVVASLSGDVDATVEMEMIYPYYRFDANCAVPTMAGCKDLSMFCLVDAVNGLGATADSFELEKESVTSEQLLGDEVDPDDAAAIAVRTVSHRLGRKLRTIRSFNVEVQPRGLVYKRFWIVKTIDVRVMVDSTNGGLHPLTLRAA